MEDKFIEALQSKTKTQIIDYAMQVRFERNFLQAQLNRIDDFVYPGISIDMIAIAQKVYPEEMGMILQNFVNFVNETKGYKIGVGQHLIERYLEKCYGRKVNE